MPESMHAGHRARLREAARNSPDLAAFSDYQTLELLLSFVIPRKDTNPIAHVLINEFGNLYGVLHASYEQLYEIPNMTENAASLLSNIYSIYRKSEMSLALMNKKVVTKIADAVALLRPYFIGKNEECIYCLALDLNDKLLQIKNIGEGTVDSSTIFQSKFFNIITSSKAKKVILAHNHPAGSLMPSQQDIDTTDALCIIMQTANTILSDHIIFCGDKYYSFYENGLLDKSLLHGDIIFGTHNCERLSACRARGDYVCEAPEPKDE